MGETMHVHCDKCYYDSGDFESTEEIEEQVHQDGGKMTWDAKGWIIKCPAGHSGNAIHLD
jgi:hypothetical protein